MNPSSNDAFGSFSSSAGIFSGGGNGAQNTMGANDVPVIVGGSSASSSGGKKKWWAFLIVVLVFVAVGGGVFALWKGGVFGNGENGAIENGPEVAFNRYANYLLSCDPSTNDAMTVFESAEAICIRGAVDETITLSDYFTKLEEYFEALRNEVMKGAYYVNSTQYVDSVFGAYEKSLAFVKAFMLNTLPSRAELLTAYNDGKLDSGQYIDKVKADFAGFDDIHGLNYHDYVVDYVDNTIKIIELYARVGCIVNGEIDYICVDTRKNSEISFLDSKLSEDLYYMVLAQEESAQDLLDGLVSLWAIIEQEEDYVDEEV